MTLQLLVWIEYVIDLILILWWVIGTFNNDQNVHFSNDQPVTHHMQFMIEMQFLIAFVWPQNDHKLDTPLYFKRFDPQKRGNFKILSARSMFIIHNTALISMLTERWILFIIQMFRPFIFWFLLTIINFWPTYPESIYKHFFVAGSLIFLNSHTGFKPLHIPHHFLSDFDSPVSAGGVGYCDPRDNFLRKSRCTITKIVLQKVW